MQSMQEPLMESLGGMITLGKKMKMFNFWFISEKVIHFFFSAEFLSKSSIWALFRI